MAASPLTPVTILTGFLGSGKTTLLNRVLMAMEASKLAVVVNEFGAVPIDHHIVREGSERVTVLPNGCVCCTAAGDMVNALRDLYFKRANGEIPAFTRVVIETTGLADPAPLLRTLIEMPIAAARYSLAGIVVTVDAEHGMVTLDQHAESVKQAAVADRIVITKTDIAPAQAVAALETRLRKLNPGADIVRAQLADAAPGWLFDLGVYRPEAKTPQVSEWLNAARQPAAGLFSGNERNTLAAQHDDRIHSFVVTLDQPVAWDALENALDTLLTVHGDGVLRMKGIVNVRGEAAPRVIHAVQHTLYPPARLTAWPADWPGRASRLVFIVRDVSPVAVERTLKSFVEDTNYSDSTIAPSVVV